MRQNTDNIIIEDAQIMWPNFSGEEGKFNPKGNRHFNVFLDYEVAKDLEEEGWNIKWLDPQEAEDNPQGHMQVAVSFANVPPKIVMITGEGKTMMNEETVGMLDWADIETADLIINPYHWDVNGKTGIKAYTKALYVTIHEDVFAEKYYDDEEELEEV